MAKKSDSSKETSKPSGNPRFWSPEQRREAFLKNRASAKEDYQVLKADYEEKLIPYNHIVLDKVLGLKGIAMHGRVAQFHGDEGAGKSTLTYYTASQFQNFTGEPIAIFDFEGTGTMEYLAKLGIDTEMCFFKQPDCIESAIKDTMELMRDAGVRFFVYDSIPYMDSKVDYKDVKSGKAFKGNYGNHAKAMSRFFKMLRPYAIETDAHMLMVNQTRDRIDEDAGNANKYSYTNRVYSLPGGRMCRFAPSVMVELMLERELRPIDPSKEADMDKLFLVEPIAAVRKNYPSANQVRLRTLKSKVTGGGFREGNIYIRPGVGVDENMSIRELARAYKLVEYSGKVWFVGTSKEDAIITYPNKTELIDDLVVKQNPEVMTKLRGLVSDCIDRDDTNRFSASVSSEEASFYSGEGSESSETEEMAVGTSFEIEEA